MIRRLSSLMVALWFALYVGAPQLLHPCPQHAVQGSWGAPMPSGHHAKASPPAAQHAMPDMKDPKATMPLPSVGAQTVMVRSGHLVIPGGA